jgi:hypothetical protein
MRKRLTWLLVTLGIAALVRRLRRRRAAIEPSPAPSTTDDPAAELRRRLAESRSEPATPEVAPETTVSERRADVHDEGRAAMEEMRSRDREE